jgi:hypothetical protein
MTFFEQFEVWWYAADLSVRFFVGLTFGAFGAFLLECAEL